MSIKPKYPSSHQVGLDYGAADSQDDILSRPASVVDDPNGTSRHLANYTYMGLANLVSSAYPVPGVAMTLIAQTGDPQSGPAGDKYTGLDRFGRVVDKRWIKTGTSNPVVDLVRAQYTYDRASNRLTHTNPVATAAGVNLDQSYSYDGLYQVATHQTGIGTGIPATEEQFTYDPTGNWNRYKALAAGAVTEDSPRTNNSANQITQIAGTPELIAHNATGNTTRIPKPADPTKSFDLKWDAWNRLVKVSDSETENPVAVYTYDGLTRRISTDDGTGTDTRRYYYNQQWRCVEEFNGEDSTARKLLKRYLWGAQNRWELIARQRDTNGNGTLNEELFVLTDAMDPVAIVSANGAVEERFNYTAFGETTIWNPDFTEKNSGSTFGWNLLFHSEFSDRITRLYNYGYRYYDQKLGRWLSRDPIGERGGTDLFCFTKNAPINHSDYFGNKPGKPEGDSVKCQEKMRKQRREAQDFVDSNGSSQTPDCSDEVGCELVTIIVEYGNPCLGFFRRGVGHTGIGIGDDYYDFGPTAGEGGFNRPGGPYWDQMLGLPEDIGLQDIVDNLSALAGNMIVVKLEFCACKETAEKARKYWRKLYSEKPTWGLGGKQCTNAVCHSLGIIATGYKSPKAFLKKMKSYKSECGASKGSAPYLEIIN